MARCTICKKTSEEIQLYTGILDAEMVMVCEHCAEEEGIPLIKKPSEKQLNRADKKYTVRERMEILSGSRDATDISDDQMVTQRNLAKLRAPPKKQYHEDVLDNYSWTLNIARRRAKLTASQLAEKTQVSSEIIRSIEKGKIPENFEEIFPKLENYLGIKLLKNNGGKINFIRKREEEDKILESVRKKIESPNSLDEPTPKKKIGLDFSSRESLENVTLNDLVEMKRAKEAREKKRKSKIQEDSILGEDIDLEEL